MEHKPIYLDGVDVSECIDFNKRDKVSCYHLLYDKCNENPNCYFKQLVRKTQECEALKSEAFTRESLITLQENEIDELRQECKELKRKVELMMDCPDCKVDKYKKALEEIENNINKYFEESFYKSCRYAKGCTSACGLATNNVFNQILDIINKAKGGNKNE